VKRRETGRRKEGKGERGKDGKEHEREEGREGGNGTVVAYIEAHNV